MQLGEAVGTATTQPVDRVDIHVGPTRGGPDRGTEGLETPALVIVVQVAIDRSPDDLRLGHALNGRPLGKAAILPLVEVDLCPLHDV